ncbi:MAG: M1 family aminopeptidase [Candidatus Krumholzibacteria bacterium]|nr:M1 family aminopeptidase [Candidatus Krumholzibacteria bacterium]
MSSALQKRIGIALFLGAAIAASAFAGCAYFEYDAAPGRPFILYNITLADSYLGIVHVSGRVLGSAARTASLGTFLGADGKRMEPIDFGAKGLDGTQLSFREKDETWTIESKGRDFSFEYDVALTVDDRHSVDVRDIMTFIDADRCRLLGRDVFLVPEFPIEEGIVVDFVMRPGWRVSSSATCIRSRIVVNDPADLPFTMTVSGEYRSLERRVGGSEIVLAIAGSWSFSDEEFFDVVCRIVSEEIALFGSSPRSRYLIICDANNAAGEDRFDYYGVHYGASMMLLLDRNLDRSELMDTPMAIIAHEFFHNWNGEALAPAGDEFLWFTEGVTNYYSYYVLLRAGVISAAQLEDRSRAIFERYRSNPYAANVSIGEAANSDMSDKNMVSLLYDGGYLAARNLDERLREDSGGRVTLVDVLKRMYENAHGSGTADESSLLSAVKELAGSDLSGYLQTLVHTPDPKPLVSRASALE